LTTDTAKNKTKYTEEAIQDILERFHRINELIRTHEELAGEDNLSLKSWKKMKKQLNMQVAGLLSDPNLIVSVKAKL